MEQHVVFQTSGGLQTKLQTLSDLSGTWSELFVSLKRPSWGPGGSRMLQPELQNQTTSALQVWWTRTGPGGTGPPWKHVLKVQDT